MTKNFKTNLEVVNKELVDFNSLTLVSIKGTGGSTTLVSLVNQSDNRCFIYFDLASLFVIDEASLVTQMSIELLDYLHKNNHITSEEHEIYLGLFQSNVHFQILLNNLNRIFRLFKNAANLYLILDHFDKILNNKETFNVDIFKYIRDVNRGKVQYIFALSDLKILPNISNQTYSTLGDLLSKKVVFLKISKDENPRETNLSNLISNNYTNKDILEVSGGYEPYIKALNTLGTLNYNPFPPELKAASERLLSSLTVEQIDILLNIARGKNKVQSSTEIDLLLKLGILVQKNDDGLFIFSDILKSYLLLQNNILGKESLEGLTKNEHRIYELLLENPNTIISKDEIAKALWNNSLNDKYSEWAINQTVKRLRGKLLKINPNAKIETKRGRGLIYRN